MNHFDEVIMSIALVDRDNRVLFNLYQPMEDRDCDVLIMFAGFIPLTIAIITKCI